MLDFGEVTQESSNPEPLPLAVLHPLRSSNHEPAETVPPPHDYGVD